MTNKLIKFDVEIQTDMDTTINQRIKEIDDKLCNGNISELARIAKTSQPALRDIVGTKQRKPGFDIIKKIADCEPLRINTEWLIRGRGPIQKSQVDILYNAPYKDVGHELIPIYDISAAANLQTLFTDNNQVLLGQIKIPNAPVCDGAIYVRGDSMYPLIKSGDTVCFKQLNSINNLIAGEIYIVDFNVEGDDFLVVKYVKWTDDNKTHLRLISYNDHHHDMIIPASAVLAMALVKIVIRVNSMV